MATTARAGEQANIRTELATRLRVGDSVMVIAGGNKKRKRVLKGQVGKILRIFPKKERVIVEGLNMIKRHKRKMSSTEPGGIIDKEGSIHISNLMYYSDDLKKPVRLRISRLTDGRKVRGFLHPKSKKFEQIDV